MRGFIQIPIIYMIIAGIIALGGIGYGASKIVFNLDTTQDDENSRIEELERQIADLQQFVASSSNQSETENIEEKTDELRQEIDALKKQNTFTPSIAPTISIPSPSQSTELSNVEIIAKVKPAVVYIETKYGSGSGMIIQGGFVLTNAHVMAGVYTANITLSDGREFEGRILGRDGLVDVALLTLPDSMRYYPLIAVLGDSDKLSVGNEIFAMGYPLGIKGSVSFKEGTMSRRLLYEGRSYFEISAELHHGNSGGPLVNSFGEVIGINTSRSLEIDEFGPVKFAIPINKVKELIPLLKAGRVVSGNKWRPLPIIDCGNNSYVTAGGECSCIQDYIDPKNNNMCRPGLSYCQVNYGYQYIFEDAAKSCVCGIGYELVGKKCVAVE